LQQRPARNTVPDWLDLLLLAGATIAAVAAAILGMAAARWNAATASTRTRLLSGQQPPTVPTYSVRQLAGLPPPVARYFRVALQEGQPIVTRARVNWTGEFNIGKPGADKWAPFTAVQDFVPGAPGMLWDARMAMAPGVDVRVRDGLVDGVGSMRAAVLGLVTVANANPSADLTIGSMQRYLAELAWLPTALLPGQGVAWTPVDATRAVATLHTGPLTTSVEFRFGVTGLIESMYVPARIFDDGRHPPSRHPWQGRCLAFTSRDGMMVPADAVVEWLLPEGAYAYWRGRPGAILYEYATRRSTVRPSAP